MSGRHRDDLPGDPGDGGYDGSGPPAFGPADDGSSDWFTPRDSQSNPIVRPGGQAPPPDPYGTPATGGPPGPSPRDTGRFGEPGRDHASPAFGTPAPGGTPGYGTSPRDSAPTAYGESGFGTGPYSTPARDSGPTPYGASAHDSGPSPYGTRDSGPVPGHGASPHDSGASPYRDTGRDGSGYGGTPRDSASTPYGTTPRDSSPSPYGTTPRDSSPSPYGSTGSGSGTPVFGAPTNDSDASPYGGSARDSGPTVFREGGAARASGEADVPEWFGTERDRPGYGTGGFTGASDPGGRAPGRSSLSAESGGARGDRDDEAAFSGAGFGAYDAISRSDGGRTGSGGSGGSRGSGGSGSGGGSGGGSGRSGGYGTGDYEYGRRKKRSVGALIGPMAGAVVLAALLGVGVYAFAGGGGGCGDDALRLDVAAAPEIQPAISKAADRFNDAEHEVGGTCVQASVRAADPSAVTTLLSGQGVESGANRRPDVWIPDSTLWTSLVRTSAKGKDAVQLTKTSVAQSPIVVGMPQSLAARLRRDGVITNPSWDNLLNAAGGTPGGAVTRNQVIPAGSVRLFVPDPTRNAVGMGSVLVANTLLTNDPNREAIFTGIVRTMRENTTPSVKAQFASFRRDRRGRYPIALAPEQAVWAHNRGGPAEPAVAVYPTEGTLLMDYPFAITNDDSDTQRAARLLEQALNTEPTRDDVRGLGFRSADGKAPTTFGAKTGVSPQRPRQLPAPQPADVQKIMQAWSKLSLSIRMLSILDVSGSMLEKVGGVTRMQATARVAQGGLSLMPNDTELGQWIFSTELDGSRDYKEIVPVGPLGDRIGSVTRRQLILSGLARIQPKPTGDTGLYDTILAAYRYMTKSYKPEFGNSILLFTDGKNDDDNGPSLRETLAELRSLVDPSRPVQVIMIGFGPGVDISELKEIAKATEGSVFVAQTPEEIQKIFLQALSRRIAD